MAYFKVNTPDEFIEKLNTLGKKGIEIGKKAVRDGAAVLADEVRKGLEKNLQNSIYSTGDLEKALGVTKATVDNKGVINSKVGFSARAYDRKGVSNIIKARVMESGSSRQPKKPFFRLAVNRSRAKIKAKIKETNEQEISKIME